MSIFIEKVEIKHFRCFDGGTKQPKVELINLTDINIISGANDSGKSNVLRALNLFFNNEIVHGVPFDIERDLCKLQKERSDNRVSQQRATGKKDVRQRDLWVKIRVHFINPKPGILPKSFYVEKTWDKSNFGIRTASNHKNNNLTNNQKRAADGQLTQFLSQFRFEYIPAIKDRQYFRYLFGKLQKSLFDKGTTSSKNFKGASKDFNNLLIAETKLLFDDFKKNTKVDAHFDIPETLIDFVRTLSVQTENGISLFERGDGIQARFIPDILNEIYKDAKNKKIIWGFEEPENSYEDKNLRKLRNDFATLYSETKQIFLTTHSFNILSMDAGNISKYRVWRDGKTSRITFIPPKVNGQIPLLKLEKDVREKLEEELGIFELTEELEKIYKEKQNELDLIKKYRESKEPTPIIFVEDDAHKLILEKVLIGKKLKIEVVGSCDKVLTMSKAFNGSHEHLYFLVDGDATQRSGKNLWHKNTLELKKYCIENYLFTETIISKLIKSKSLTISEKDFVKTLATEAMKSKSSLASLVKMFDLNKFEWAILDVYPVSDMLEKAKVSFNLDKYDFIKRAIAFVEKENKLSEVFSEIIDWAKNIN